MSLPPQEPSRGTPSSPQAWGPWEGCPHYLLVGPSPEDGQEVSQDKLQEEEGKGQRVGMAWLCSFSAPLCPAPGISLHWPSYPTPLPFRIVGKKGKASISGSYQCWSLWLSCRTSSASLAQP